MITNAEFEFDFHIHIPDATIDEIHLVKKCLLHDIAYFKTAMINQGIANPESKRINILQEFVDQITNQLEMAHQAKKEYNNKHFPRNM